MRLAVDDRDFLAAPVGAWLHGDGFVFGMPDPAFYVTLIRGRPSAEAIRRLVACWRADQAPHHVSLFDASALDGVEPDAFGVLAQEIQARADDYARSVVRQAIVTPRGFPGAVVAGYRAMFQFPFPVQLFDERRAALAWLDRTSTEPAIDEALALVDGDVIIAGLRSLLAASLDVKLGEAARKLGVSGRSLQRRLALAGSSFQAEVQAARVAAAKRLLVDTDRKLTAIALDVGYGTLQSFASMFRKATGETPSEYRARHRR